MLGAPGPGENVLRAQGAWGWKLNLHFDKGFSGYMNFGRRPHRAAKVLRSPNRDWFSRTAKHIYAHRSLENCPQVIGCRAE